MLGAALTARRRRCGQAMVETTIAMIVILIMFLAQFNLADLIRTKLLVENAAVKCARARAVDGRGDALVVRRDDHFVERLRAQARFGDPPHERLSANRGEAFAGETGRTVAGRDDGDGSHVALCCSKRRANSEFCFWTRKISRRSSRMEDIASARQNSGAAATKRSRASGSTRSSQTIA